MSSVSLKTSCMSSIIKCEDGTWIVKASYELDTKVICRFTITDVEFSIHLMHMFDNYYKVLRINQVSYRSTILKYDMHYKTIDFEELLVLIKDISNRNYILSTKQSYQFFAPLTPWDYREELKFERVTHAQLVSLFFLYDVHVDNLIKLSWNSVYNMWDVRITSDSSVRNEEYRRQQIKNIADAATKLFPDSKIDLWTDFTIRFFIKV